jgi:hypothetical protein
VTVPAPTVVKSTCPQTVEPEFAGLGTSAFGFGHRRPASSVEMLFGLKSVTEKSNPVPG